MPTEIILTEPGVIQYRVYEEKEPGPEEVRIRVQYSRVKTDIDLPLYTGQSSLFREVFDEKYCLFVGRTTSSSSLPLGIWVVGQVEKVGKGVSGITEGERVGAPLPHRPSHIVSADRIIPLKTLPTLPALLLDETLAALYDVRKASITVGDTVVLMGLGTLGLLTLQIAKIAGASKVIVVSSRNSELALARKLGADELINWEMVRDLAKIIRDLTQLKGADVVMSTRWDEAYLKEATRSVRPGGRVVLEAFYWETSAGKGLSKEWFCHPSLLIPGFFNGRYPQSFYEIPERQEFIEKALHLLTSGQIQYEGLITHFLPYERIEEVYRLLQEADNGGEYREVALQY